MVLLSQQQQDVIRGIMSHAVANSTLPALFFGLTDTNGEVFMHTEGGKVLGDSLSEKIDENTVFWLCSQTKLITSIAALQLVEQGKIQLNTPASQILPELADPVVVKGTVAAPAENPITFGNLLNHTSGLQYPQSGSSGRIYGARINAKGEDSSHFFKFIKHDSAAGQPLKFEPGTDFGYGYSTDCVGFIVERISGKSLDQYFTDHIFLPLGLTSTSFYLTPDLKERFLPMTFRDPNGNLVKSGTRNHAENINQDPENMNIHLGGVGLYGSQKDYLTLLRHLLQIQAGTATNPILSTASVAALFEPTLDTDTLGPSTLAKVFGMAEGTAQFSRALMVNTEDLPGRRKKKSGSWAGYACTSFFIDPESGIAAVFGTQLFPFGNCDLKYEKLWVQVEKALYRGLQAERAVQAKQRLSYL